MSNLNSGKGHKDENFPVASWLVKPQYRAPVMAYYHFARVSDDIADHPTAPDAEKLRLLAEMRAGLNGQGAPEAVKLGEVARASGLDLTHAHDLLDAFVLDVTKRRYQDWDDLIAYCRLSAVPVGRFVLDVHGEDRALWPMNDALCAALQVINHLQDCGKDYHALDRVYIPEPLVNIADLGADAASPALIGVIRDLARQTQNLLRQSAPFARAIRDPRLSAEVAVIQALAEDLTKGLLTRDPLSQNVHHGKLRSAMIASRAITRNLYSRSCRAKSRQTA